MRSLYILRLKKLNLNRAISINVFPQHVLVNMIRRLFHINFSSLHWPIAGFLYAFFVQWSINSDQHKFPTLSLPHPYFERPEYRFTCSNRIPSLLTPYYSQLSASFHIYTSNTLTTQIYGSSAQYSIVPKGHKESSNQVNGDYYFVFYPKYIF